MNLKRELVVCSSASMTCRGLCRCFCQVQQVKEAERSGVAAQRLLAVTCDASARLTGALRTGSLPQVLDIYPKNHCEREDFSAFSKLVRSTDVRLRL